MAHALFPATFVDRLHAKAPNDILDEFILCGNRRCDNARTDPHRRRVKEQGLRSLTLSGPLASSNCANLNISDEGHLGDSIAVNPETELAPSPHDGRAAPTSPTGVGSIDFLASIELPSHEFLSIVERIDHPELCYGDLDVGPYWLAGEGMPSVGYVWIS
ncbi:fungal-specific transcription factor domain-containing protein [Penicillium herquei]|nr:fungal-specific transcription factor domain-containing protein [Penicillium herquei]